MSNPAVINLTTTKVCGREVKIEDNLGEAMHIHFGEIRIDLTVKEFEELAAKAENILDQMNDLINTSLFSWRDLNLLFFQNPKNTDILFKLNNVYIERIRLKEILVDSYINIPLVGRIPVYRSLKHSRVVKALQGKPQDNKKYNQLNTLFISNEERVKENFDSIQKNGYPINNEYIILNHENMIIDGQHRAACLYHLYGPEYEIPVMKWEFPDNSHVYFPQKQSLARIILKAYCSRIVNFARKVFRFPFRLIRKLKAGKVISRKSENFPEKEFHNAISKDSISTLQEAMEMLKDEGIEFLVIDVEEEEPEKPRTISLLVSKESQFNLKKCMGQYGFSKCQGEEKRYNYLYSLDRDTAYSNGSIIIHECNQLFCKSLFEDAMIPLDQEINNAAWATKEYNGQLQCFQIGSTIKVILSLVQSVFMEGQFSEKRKQYIFNNFNRIDNEEGRKLLYKIFYGFTDRLLIMVRNHQFESIVKEYMTFTDY